MFEPLGLSDEAEDLYLAMLKFADDDVDSLCRRSSVGESQVRSLLGELATVGLVRESWLDPAMPRAVAPEVGLAALVAREQTKIHLRQQQIDDLKSGIAKLAASYAEICQVGEIGVEPLTGIHEIQDRLQLVAQSCEWEACSLSPGGAQSTASIEASRLLDAAAIDRGVRLRTIYLDSIRNDKPTLEYANWLTELGSEVRTAPTLPLRMLIVDRKLAVVPARSDDSAEKALMVSAEGVVTAVWSLFQALWKSASALGAPRRRRADDPSTQEMQVLKLLCAGNTDETIARRMGVSVRTARRVAGELLARLGARSRFQAGAAAMARGWLQEEDLD